MAATPSRRGLRVRHLPSDAPPPPAARPPLAAHCAQLLCSVFAALLCLLCPWFRPVRDRLPRHICRLRWRGAATASWTASTRPWRCWSRRRAGRSTCSSAAATSRWGRQTAIQQGACHQNAGKLVVAAAQAVVSPPPPKVSNIYRTTIAGPLLPASPHLPCQPHPPRRLCATWTTWSAWPAPQVPPHRHLLQVLLWPGQAALPHALQ